MWCPCSDVSYAGPDDALAGFRKASNRAEGNSVSEALGAWELAQADLSPATP